MPCDAGCVKAIIDAMIQIKGAADSLAHVAQLAGPSKMTPEMVNQIADQARGWTATMREHRAALGFPSPAVKEPAGEQ
jgi:hypothetical protein